MTAEKAGLNRKDPGSHARVTERRVRRFAVAAFVIGLVLIVWFGLLSEFPSSADRILSVRIDLVEHVAAFGWLSFTGLLLWKRARLVVGGLVLSAGLLEIAQMATRRHEANLGDWGASVTGVIVGWGLWLLARRLMVRPRELAPQDGVR